MRRRAEVSDFILKNCRSQVRGAQAHPDNEQTDKTQIRLAMDFARDLPP
jgi:hypothetical protein